MYRIKQNNHQNYSDEKVEIRTRIYSGEFVRHQYSISKFWIADSSSRCCE